MTNSFPWMHLYSNSGPLDCRYSPSALVPQKLLAGNTTLMLWKQPPTGSRVGATLGEGRREVSGGVVSGEDPPANRFTDIR